MLEDGGGLGRWKPRLTSTGSEETARRPVIQGIAGAGGEKARHDLLRAGTRARRVRVQHYVRHVLPDAALHPVFDRRAAAWHADTPGHRRGEHNGNDSAD